MSDLRTRAIAKAASLPVGNTRRKQILAALVRMARPAVPIGNTVETPHLRIHRYRDNVHIWDLTNAGKRGKKVAALSLSVHYLEKNDLAMARFDRWLGKVVGGMTYDQTKRSGEALVAELSRTVSPAPSIRFWQERGVDVDPPQSVMKRVKYTVLDTPERVITVEAKPSDVTIREVIHRVDDRGEREFYMHDTQVANTRKRRETQALYNWVVANEAKLKRVQTLRDVRDLLKRDGIPYRTYDIA